MKARRWPKLVGGIILVGAMAAVGMALAPPLDLRPDNMSTDAVARERGRALVDALMVRYGGLAHWRSLRATQLDVRDYWPDGIMKLAACPWLPGESLRFTYLNGRDMGRLTFRGGERDGSVWGLQHWMPYTETAAGARTFAANDDIKFWLPTIQYFAEMPFRIAEADALTYAGERTLNGQTYDLVYATWGGFEPRNDVDQYLLWINRATGLLDWAQYTVRDAGKFIQGSMQYEDLRTVDGLLVPFRMTSGGTPNEPEVMHRFEVEAVSFLPQLAESEIIPEPARRGRK